MKDRLMGFLGTMGLVLVMVALMPSTDLLASGGGSGCSGKCREAHGGEGKCVSVGADPCKGSREDDSLCACPGTKPDDGCTCQ